MPRHDMDRMISSEARLLSLCFGISWLLLSGGVLVWGIMSGNRFLTFSGLITLFVGLIIFTWTYKKFAVVVKITSQGLYVRLFKKSCCVPFTNIKSVSGGLEGPFRFPNQNIVIIDFIEPTLFGTRIKFIPAIDLDTYFDTWQPLKFENRQNAIVRELNNLVERYKLLA